MMVTFDGPNMFTINVPFDALALATYETNILRLGENEQAAFFAVRMTADAYRKCHEIWFSNSYGFGKGVFNSSPLYICEDLILSFRTVSEWSPFGYFLLSYNERGLHENIALVTRVLNTSEMEDGNFTHWNK